MEQKHSRTPWRYKPQYGDGSGPILAADGKTVATIVANSRRPEAEKRANGKLIEAAPDSIRANHLLVKAADHQQNPVIHEIATVLRNQGYTDWADRLEQMALHLDAAVTEARAAIRKVEG